ncbi:hypothetical protein BITS_0442 [Bifidobacterium tsurumiense]|uniref:Uncharacterized protein n=1 Tax=Bifidobacterium tsurumiense TaxID=356829 RepID=A0A087EK17_9BIFI|nr:hypothetical protein BITS_0442 [Bifidobacterium tsurumiense]
MNTIIQKSQANMITIFPCHFPSFRERGDESGPLGMYCPRKASPLWELVYFERTFCISKFPYIAAFPLCLASCG